MLESQAIQLTTKLGQQPADLASRSHSESEAVEKAKREDKPIFLSIGYSACHWCHVMEHESFEDEGIAALLDEHFVIHRGGYEA